MRARLPDNRAVIARRFVRRFAACLALFSLLGWMELPSEHIHTAPDPDHAAEHVHRHFVVHAAAPHGHPEFDHDEDAVYLHGLAAELCRAGVPAPQPLAAAVGPVSLQPPVAHAHATPSALVRVHPPPWRTLYTRRGPPAFAV